MKTRQAGFSIVEVMLVLAIVFVLFVAMMGTVHVSINRQRYEDSLKSLRDFFQRQYTEVQNTALDSGVAPITECDSSGGVRSSQRGRTDCYVIGRLLNFETSGAAARSTKIKVEQIVYKPQSGTTSSSDSLIYDDFIIREGDVGAARFNTFGREVDQYTVEWGAILKNPGSGPTSEVINNNLAVFVFRSPESGTVRTHILKRKVSPSEIKSMLTADSLKNDQDLCVIPDGQSYTDLRAIRIRGGSSNASGIEVMLPGNDSASGEVKCAR